MPIFSVISPIQHDGKPYAEGSTIQMEQEQAEPLLELKAIIPLGSTVAEVPVAEDPMIATQQVSGKDPTSIDPKKAPPSTAKIQQQKG